VLVRSGAASHASTLHNRASHRVAAAFTLILLDR
jgi:hypothetical protein